MNKEDLLNKLEKLGVPCCFNKQEYNFEKAKYIIVGDNPGREEYCQERYFVGPAGKNLKKILEEKKLINCFEEDCIARNKTFIHTKKTNQLKCIVDRDLLNKTLVCCAKEVISLSEDNNLPVLIFGKTGLKKGGIFECFWKEISTARIDKLLVLSHPSFGNLKNELKKFEECTNLTNSDLIQHVGCANVKSISDSYLVYNNLMS